MATNANKTKFVIFIAFQFSLAALMPGCSNTTPKQSKPTIPGPWHVAMDELPNISKEEEEQCDKLNGTISQAGLLYFACVYPSQDAGKKCTDSSDCAGLCRTSDETPAGTEATGECEALVNGGQYGNFVEDGRALGLKAYD